MAKIKLTLSEGHNPNYVASICRVGELHPIENSDRLARAVIDGYDVVVQNTMSPDDIVIYVPVESVICGKYLRANNDYEISEWQKNSNAAEVGELLNKGDEESRALAKSKVGFFGKNGRVRPIRLRGVASIGYIAPVSSIEKMDPSTVGTKWEDLVGTSFDEVNGEKFCWKFIPPVNEPTPKGNGSKNKKMQKRVNRFKRIIPGTYLLHYDTQHLNKNMHVFSPDDIITISVKVHGSLGELAKVLVKRKLTFKEKVKKFFGFKVVETEYGNIYSSHHEIKNEYINPGAEHFYGTDVWGAVNEVFYPYLDEGMTIYGEIVGYCPGSDTMIQKRHDYGCEVGQWKFMPYRITSTQADGSKFEWNLMDVDAWTHKLVDEHPELADKVLFLTILYHGRFGDLYPDIDPNNHWHENVLERMKNDKTLLLMEELEPMCHLYEKEHLAAIEAYEKAKADGASKKVLKQLEEEVEKYFNLRAPREGVVIRKDNDPLAEAWKLKTNAHAIRVACRQHDAGEVDMEETA